MANLTVSWSQIEAECGDYRAGFVATFRKYEGRDTDEVAGNGQIIRVTVASFARHMGIPRQTFNDWVNAADQEVAPAASTRDRTRESINRMPAPERAKLAAELLEDEDVVEQVVSDPPTRRNLRRAVQESTLSTLPDPNYEPTKPARGGVADAFGAMADELEIQELIRKARLAIRDAIKVASDRTFDEDYRELAIEEITRLRAGIDFLESAIQSETVDANDALAALLKGEADGGS